MPKITGKKEQKIIQFLKKGKPISVLGNKVYDHQPKRKVEVTTTMKDYYSSARRLLDAGVVRTERGGFLVLVED